MTVSDDIRDIADAEGWTDATLVAVLLNVLDDLAGAPDTATLDVISEIMDGLAEARA